MPLRLKSIYDPPSPDDGHRVLATQYWPRGVRKTTVDEYLRVLAPSRELLRTYKDQKIWWPEFTERYRAEIVARPEAKEALARLRKLARDGTVTLMCTCRMDQGCHRTLLKEPVERER